jgi:hypothetical protein
MFKRFRVLLNGKNFKLIENDQLKPVSFVTTRYVDAGDVKEAEEKAKSLIFDDLITTNENLGDAPTLKILEVEQVNWITSRFRGNSGYTFYESKPQ